MWLVQGQLQLKHTCSVVLSTWRGSLTLRLMDCKSAGRSVWWPVRPLPPYVTQYQEQSSYWCSETGLCLCMSASLWVMFCDCFLMAFWWCYCLSPLSKAFFFLFCPKQHDKMFWTVFNFAEMMVTSQRNVVLLRSGSFITLKVLFC